MMILPVLGGATFSSVVFCGIRLSDRADSRQEWSLGGEFKKLEIELFKHRRRIEARTNK
jgi:hypothetical protein